MAGSPHSKQSQAVAKQAVDQQAVIGLLLDTAALEHWVRHLTFKKEKNKVCLGAS